MHKKHWTFAFWSCTAVVLLLALAPLAGTPSSGSDKTDHLIAFSVLAILGIRSYPAFIVPVIVGLVLYGGLIEILQALIPYRYGQWSDLVADGIGILIGWGAERLLRASGR